VQRVVVTGVGIVSALGIGAEPTWRALMAGSTAVGPITAFDASSLRSRLAAEVPGFEPRDFVSNRKSLRMMTRGDQMAVAAARLALDDGGVSPSDADADRFGLFLGGSKEIAEPENLQEAVLAARQPDGSVDMARFGLEATATVYPLFYILGLPGAALFFISEAFGLKGANAYFAGTAEASAVAVGTAFRAIRRGEVDSALAGGFADPITWWTMTKFDALGLLTDRNLLGGRACRPFDLERNGAVLGEGAAILLLESEASARRRRARILAEVVGFGSAFRSSAFLTPSPDGSDVADAVAAASRERGSDGAGFSYVVTHGSATSLGDASEVRGIRTALGPAANDIAASSVKAATGHLLGAAGGLNACVAALAVARQEVPPSLNLETPDQACDLPWVLAPRRSMLVQDALAIARGIEGQAVALAFRGYQ
jgi:3-oxoacyl-[acyl-carrier-protein] synthase II